jgi:hypothetical protein
LAARSAVSRLLGLCIGKKKNINKSTFYHEMTKPECSKKEPTREKTKTKIDSPEKDSKLTNPATAKDLFSVFAPEESDNDEVDIEKRDDKKDENYEPACKKSKDNNSKVSECGCKN